MTLGKSLLLGSAAGLAFASAAHAADLPVKAKAVAQYVRICTTYGTGYYYIPGTDTCVKYEGYVRAETNYNAQGGGTPNYNGAAGRQTRADTSEYSTRVRAWLGADARQESEYGTVRSYFRIGIQNQNQNVSDFYFARAFVQFAGFTFGRAASPTDIFFLTPYAYSTTQIGSDTDGSGVNLVSYTAQFGNGWSFLIGTEEKAAARAKSVINLSSAGALAVGSAAASSASAQHYPDFEGVLRWDQTWGDIGAFVAGHDASGGYYTTGAGVPAAISGTTLAGHPDEALGWAAGIGGELKLPNFGAGDKVGFQFVYSEGAAGYATFNHNNAGLYGSGNSVAVGWLSDSVYATGTQVQLTTAWSIVGAYEHNWSTSWQTSVYGALLNVDYNATATSLFCVAGTTAVAQTGVNTLSNCNPDYSVWYVGSRTQWKPVKNLSLGLDVMYTDVTTAFAGTGVLGTVGARPAGAYSIRDQGIVSAMFRVQKDFGN
jgi:hypothetical protein